MTDTTANNKRVAKNTLFLYIRMTLTMAVSLYSSRVVLNVLGVEDYGTYNVVGGVVTMFSFLNATLAVSTQRFLSFDIGKSDMRMLHTTFFMAVVLHLLMAMFILVLAETIGLWFLMNKMVFTESRMNAVFWVYQISVITAMINITQIPFSAAINAHERMDIYAYASIADVVLKLLAVILLQWIYGDKLIAYAILLFAVTTIMALFYRFYCLRHFKECTFKKSWDKTRFKEMLSFSGWNTSAQFALVARTQGVNIILNLFFGTVINAARGVGVAVFSIVSGFANNIIVAINPQLVKYYAQKDYAAMQQLIIKGSKFTFFLLFLIALPIIMETDYLLTLWLKKPPEIAPLFCRLILISALIDALSNVVGYGALASGKVKTYQLVMSSVFICIPVVLYLMYKLYNFPPETCIYAEMLCYLFALFFRPILTSRIFPFSVKVYFHECIIRIIPVVACSLIIPLYIIIHIEPSFYRFITTVIICLLGSLSAIIGIGFSVSERRKALKLIKKLLLK